MKPKRISIPELMRVIEQFPSDDPVENPRAWFKTEKEHWLVWLSNFGGSGYGPKVVIKRDAEYAYNHALSPDMLLYLMHSIPLSVEQAKIAELACTNNSGRVERLNAIRNVVPWVDIYQAIWGEAKRPKQRKGGFFSEKSRKPPKELVDCGKVKLVPALPVNVPNLALSIHQPYAEQILRGIKKIEYRPMACRIRNRVYLYASLKPTLHAYASMGTKPGDFPTGVIVGTMEIVDCTYNGVEYEWHLARPERLEQPIKPEKHPQPSWFKPFEEQD